MEKKITISQKYLLIPVKAENELKIVSFYVDNEKIYEFAIPIGESNGMYDFHYYAALPVHKWLHKQITIKGDVKQNFLEACAQSDVMPKNVHKNHMVHFSPNTGWLNDPNGLVYQNGVYHLYFQHNPFDTRWQNMSWGHAVSTDLLHWEQKDDVLFPDEDGTMFSGSGIRNDRELLNLPKDALIFFYTCAGNALPWSKDKKFVQKIAYSTDAGNSLIKMDGHVISHITADNRDPKVYWHEEKQLYYMVLYLDKNDYAIFNSKDLLHWEMTQKLTIPGAWECPDLQKIPVECGGSKWLFWTADGYYCLGDFDGSHFKTDGIRHEAYHSMLPYAAQTYFGTERVIIIPWMRTQSHNRVYTGMMGIPRQLSLVKKDGDYVLRQKMVDELENSKQEVLKRCLIDGESVSYAQQREAAVEVVLEVDRNADFIVNIYGTECSLEKGTLKIKGIAKRTEGVQNAANSHDKECLVDENQEYRLLKMKEDMKKISFLSDGEILEVTVDDGLICGAYETVVSALSGEINVQVYGNVKVNIYQIV